MANCLIAYPDLTLGASSITGGSWNLPLSNLTQSETYTKARSNTTATAATTFTIDNGSQKDMRVLALIGHNASLDGTVRVRCSNVSDFSTTLFDSGWVPFWQSLYPLGALEWEDRDFWSCGVPDLSKFPKSKYFILTNNTSIVAQYVRVEISDVNNPDGFFELARCFVASAWQPSINMLYGASITRKTSTQVDYSKSNTAFYEKYPSRRVVNFSLDLPELEALAYAWQMQLDLDISEELFFVYNPDDVSLIEQSRSFLCTNEELSPLEAVYFGRNSNKFKFQEVL